MDERNFMLEFNTSLLRHKNPEDAAKDALRRLGYIVERPETLSIPIHVARTGSFTSNSGYAIKLHVRANIGGKMAQCDQSIDVLQANSNMPIASIANSIGYKFSKFIMDELTPQISMGIAKEINEAMREND